MAFSADAEFTTSLTLASEALCNIADELTSYYRLEEASGTAFDVRGSDGDLTLGTTPGNAGGKVGNARNFVRASGHSLVSADNDHLYFDGTQDFTVTCWGSTDDLGAADQAFWSRWRSTDNNRGPMLFFDAFPSDHVRFVMSLDGSTNAINVEPTLSLSSGTLYFFEVTYVASTRVARLRINRGTGATFDASAVVPAGVWHKPAINFTIGDATSGGNVHLDGLVDELTVHDRVLTDAELDAMYDGGSGRNINDFLFRKFEASFDATAGFTTTLSVSNLVAEVTVDADFTTPLIVEGDVFFATLFSADADFATALGAERGMAVDFVAEVTAAALSVERSLAVSVVAEANFQADPFEVFDAFQVALEADADFGQDLSVVTDIEIVSDLQADADFVMLLEIDDRALRVDMTALADFTTAIIVARDVSVDVGADVDFTMVMDLSVQPLMAVFSADADFQVNFGFANLALAFSFSADVDFLADLFTADHNAYSNDLLGLTDQLESDPRVKVAGIGANLDPTVLDTQWQIETLQDDTFLEYLKVDGIVFGETTGAAPAPLPITTHHAYFDTRLGVGHDWFDRLFVLPSSVELGFVISDVSVPFQIYSSYKTATRSLDSTVNNVDSGFSFGGGFPVLPESILPQTGFAFTVEVDNEGPPLIDGTIDFVFDTITIEIPFTGQRTVLFSPAPSLPLRERLRFRTDILLKRTEEEQRVAVRFAPRQELIYQYELDGFDRQCLEALVFDAQGRAFGVPIWWEPIFLTAPITQGDLVVNVEETAYRDVRVGSLVAVWQDTKTFEVAEVAFKTATTITLATQAVLDHPATSRVYPVRIAYMDGVVRGSKEPVNLQKMRVRFRVLDNDTDLSDTSAFPTFNGKVFLDEPNWIRSALQENFERRLITVDNETGTFEVTAFADVSRRGYNKTFLSTSYQRLWEVRQLLHALKGEQVSFYIPSFYDEFTPTVDVSNGDDTLTFRNFGYTRFVQDRQPRNVVQLVKTDGTKVLRTVIGSTELSVDEERIQVDSAWGVDATLDEIERVEYVTKARIASDDVTIEHRDTLGQAIVKVPVKAVLE